uniref:NAD-dependent epimerase/dehydratase domain-containing protein n=1 Tax=Cannabis sativa TaxID=3483 RepID=A0A803NX89_CANSA
MGDQEQKGIVCVTGGTGYIGSWLIMRLLQHGYTVRTTIRPDHDPTASEGIKKKRDISFLTNLPRASEKLEIYHADLNQPESFSAAIEGCSGVFHVAHPVTIVDEESEEVLTKRCLDAALGILKACIASKTVKRVVYTSSSAAISVLNDETGQQVADESSWSDVDWYRSQKRMGISYVAAKTKTEKAMFEFGEKFGLDIITLNPSLVLGPFICPTLPGSVAMGLTMILGDTYNIYKYLLRTNMVHIEDVVSAHIFLYENTSAKGRYICSSDELSLIGMSEFLSERYPNFQIPKKESLEGIEGYKIIALSSKKLLDSGFKFKFGLAHMFDGAIQSCKERNIL